MVFSQAKSYARKWTFAKASLTLFLIYMWFELLMTIARKVVFANHGSGTAFALFATLLPAFALIVYFLPRVVGFFLSVRVAVINLCFIGLGSVIGVLFQQEDPNWRTPEGAVEELVLLGQQDDKVSPSFNARRAYAEFENFREAETFFIYHLFNNIGLRSSLGFEGKTAGDESKIQEMLSNLEARLPNVEKRFGAEKAIAIKKQSETGLRTRAKNSEIRELEERLNDQMFSLFVIADKLDFRRAYRSDWFAAMWGVLFFGLLCALLRNGLRPLFTLKKAGFALTHLGVMLIIVGGLMGNISDIRGIVELNIGQQKNQYFTWSQQPKFFGESNPFSIKLEDFRADQHDVLDVVYLTYEDENLRQEFPLDNQPSFRVFEGMTEHFDYNDGGEATFKVNVVDYAPQTKAILSEDGLSVVSYEAIEDADFFNPAPASIEVRVEAVERGGVIKSETFMLHAGKNASGKPFAYTAFDGEPRIVWLKLREDTQENMPLEWQSKLSIYRPQEDANKPIAQGTVRVNDYFTFEGYRFFQTNHNPEDPTYSGIGVVYDPGIPLVIWGLYIVMFAVAYVFLIRPLILVMERDYGKHLRKELYEESN